MATKKCTEFRFIILIKEDKEIFRKELMKLERKTIKIGNKKQKLVCMENRGINIEEGLYRPNHLFYFV